MTNLNLKSSVSERGKRVTEIIHFIDGSKKTFPHIKPETIVEGSFVHFETEDGRLIMINPKNVNIVEVFTET